MIISERIFQIMRERGISQRDFSQRTGIAQSTISDWKRKKTNPASDKILVICEVLEVSPYTLLSGSSISVDYFVVENGSEEHKVLETYHSLNLAHRGRMLGYMEALSDLSKETLPEADPEEE